MGVDGLEMLADRGYFSGEEILACEALGVTPYVPKPLTSNAKAEGRFGKQDFTYLPDQDVYRCPAGALLPHHMTTVERGMTLHRYWDRASCQSCALKRAVGCRLGAGFNGVVKLSVECSISGFPATISQPDVDRKSQQKQPAKIGL
jgi:hypothetical protein